MAANITKSAKEMNPKKKRKEQAKYMISRTLTTEKQAKIMDPRKPRIASPKKIP